MLISGCPILRVLLREGWEGDTLSIHYATRTVRYQQTKTFHFLTFSCYHRKPLLNFTPAYAHFEQQLEAVRRQYQFVVAGYVLMPEHVHLLVSEPQIGSLSTAIQVLKQQTSRELDKHGEAQFWQRRYYDFNAWTEEQVREKLHYMHRNPLRRGLVTEPQDWPWSSFRHYATGVPGTVEIESDWTAWRREREAQKKEQNVE